MNDWGQVRSYIIFSHLSTIDQGDICHNQWVCWEREWFITNEIVKANRVKLAVDLLGKSTKQ